MRIKREEDSLTQPRLQPQPHLQPQPEPQPTPPQPQPQPQPQSLPPLQPHEELAYEEAFGELWAPRTVVKAECTNPPATNTPTPDRDLNPNSAVQNEDEEYRRGFGDLWAHHLAVMKKEEDKGQLCTEPADDTEAQEGQGAVEQPAMVEVKKEMEDCPTDRSACVAAKSPVGTVVIIDINDSDDDDDKDVVVEYVSETRDIISGMCQPLLLLRCPCCCHYPFFPPSFPASVSPSLFQRPFFSLQNSRPSCLTSPNDGSASSTLQFI